MSVALVVCSARARRTVSPRPCTPPAPDAPRRRLDACTAGAGGERSRTVHAYRVNTLAGEVFTRVNTSPWQVFTHLPLNPKKSLCGTRLAVWRTRSVPTDNRQSSNSRSDNSSVSASYSSVEDLCAYLNTSGMLRRMWFFRWKACRPYHTICGWTDNSQAKAGRGVDTIMLRHLHCRRHQFICKPSQV